MARRADPGRGDRDGYHHGNLREALIQAAMALIAEKGLAGFAVIELARAVGVSSAAPYRHFRDREAVIAEVGRRGFESMASEMRDAVAMAGDDRSAALEACAQAHLAFAAREPPVYSTMFEPHFPVDAHPDLTTARDAAFGVLRQAAQAACDGSATPRRPPALMVALHVWSMTHGIADLFIGHDGQIQLPMTPAELLEAGILIYLQELALPPP